MEFDCDGRVRCGRGVGVWMSGTTEGGIKMSSDSGFGLCLLSRSLGENDDSRLTRGSERGSYGTGGE